MNFDTPILKIVRLLLFPLSLIYGFVIRCRNWCYDRGIFHSQTFGIPVICVGNLSVGGTGKTPMVELLVRILSTRFNLAIVSRGYKRNTSGFIIADVQSTTADLGDEPMQFHEKFPGVTVAVGEKRVPAIEQVLEQRPHTNIIILDDAFQHRAVKAGLNLLLTDYNHLYSRDMLLPSGNLRDEKRSARRAQVIVVTKCPETLTEPQRIAILKELKPQTVQAVFFASIRYGAPYPLQHSGINTDAAAVSVLLVTGIADPARLREHLKNSHQAYHELVYPDHHAFAPGDIDTIRNRFSAIAGPKIIVTTEKDATRLKAYTKQLDGLPVYVIPIECSFLFGDSGRFTDLIGTFIQRFDHKNITQQ